MTNHTNNNDARRRQAPRRRRRRNGVPLLLTVILLIMALLMGGLAGLFIARRTDTHIHELNAANNRITALENKLTLLGLDDDDDVEQWLYDNTVNDSALEELAGTGWDDDDEEEELWNDASLLDGTLAVDEEPVVVAEFEGGELLSSEVVPEYNDQLTTLIFAGKSADDVAEDTLNRVLAQLAGDKIIALRARELGLTELTAEDLAAIERQAAENYEAQLADYLAFADNSDESRETAAQHLAQESGVTPESVAETLKKNWWAQKFYDYIVQDVEVTDEEVQAHYDALLAEQRTTFTSYPDEFEYAHMTGQPIVFRPEGYRAVRDILVAFSDADAETAAELTDRLDRGDGEDGDQEALNALYAPLEKTAQEIQDKLNDGASFSELMDEYGCDAALAEEPLRSEGYYVSDHSYVNSVEYVEGSMLLEQPGQVSAPLRSVFGLHLVQYIGDVTPGEVPLEDVLDTMRADALKAKQAEYYDHQRQALLEAANVKYYPERLH